MPMLHEYSPIRRSRNWTIMNVQAVLDYCTAPDPPTSAFLFPIFCYRYLVSGLRFSILQPFFRGFSNSQ